MEPEQPVATSQGSQGDALQASPPPSDNKKKWLKWLIIGGVIFVVLSVVVAVASAFHIYRLGQDVAKLESSPASELPPAPPPVPGEPTTGETANWKTYKNINYGFSFKHPDLDSSCCNIAGPIIGNPKRLVVLANTATVHKGTDASFDGLAIYIDTPQVALNTAEGFASYIYGQKNSLIENYREFVGSEPKKPRDEAITVNGKQGNLLLGYAAWGDIIYVPFSDNKNVLVIVKTEASEGSFDTTFDQILSTFKFTE